MQMQHPVELRAFGFHLQHIWLAIDMYDSVNDSQMIPGTGQYQFYPCHGLFDPLIT